MLELFLVPAFLTDPVNRILFANNVFRRLIGDPVSAGLAADDRFIPALLLGPFRDRFPRRYQEIAQCLGSVDEEIARGRLSARAARLVQDTVLSDNVLARLASKDPERWDGTVVVRDQFRRSQLLKETVVPLTDARGNPNRFHISIWTPVDPGSGGTDSAARDLLQQLTPRQRDIAVLFASGLSAPEVAVRAGITARTARDHLEAIHGRLGIHSRAELAALVSRAAHNFNGAPSGIRRMTSQADSPDCACGM
jgi:DNA-binding CsgD family transcriptional regulator